MKKFLINILIFLLLLISVSEITYSPHLYKNLFFSIIFPSIERVDYRTILDGDIIERPNHQYLLENPDQNYNDSLLIKTNSFGYVSDFDTTDFNKKTVAFVGDSQFAGIKTGNEYSIERSLGICLGEKFFVRNFSLQGQNYKDYVIDYDKFNLAKYDFVFIFINNGDINNLPPQRKRFIPNVFKLNFFYFIQDYLRINLEIGLPKILSNENITYVLFDDNLINQFKNYNYITLSDLKFGFLQGDKHFNRDDTSNISNKICQFLNDKNKITNQKSN